MQCASEGIKRKIGATACKPCPARTGTGGKTGQTLSTACKTGQYNAVDESDEIPSSDSATYDNTGLVVAGCLGAAAFIGFTAYVVVKKVKQRSQTHFNTNDKV
jgi:hypothetical protein